MKHSIILEPKVITQMVFASIFISKACTLNGRKSADAYSVKDKKDEDLTYLPFVNFKDVLLVQVFSWHISIRQMEHRVRHVVLS